MSGPTFADVIMIDIACKYVYVEKNFIYIFIEKAKHEQSCVAKLPSHGDRGVVEVKQDIFIWLHATFPV